MEAVVLTHLAALVFFGEILRDARLPSLGAACGRNAERYTRVEAGFAANVIKW
jgi:hypothetical protein